MSLRSSSQEPPGNTVPVYMSNAIGSSRESNPSRRMCQLRAVTLGCVADEPATVSFKTKCECLNFCCSYEAVVFRLCVSTPPLQIFGHLTPTLFYKMIKTQKKITKCSSRLQQGRICIYLIIYSFHSKRGVNFFC